MWHGSKRTVRDDGDWQCGYGVFVFAQSAIKSTRCFLRMCVSSRECARVCIQRFTDTIIYAWITAQAATTKMREKYVPT